MVLLVHLSCQKIAGMSQTNKNLSYEFLVDIQFTGNLFNLRHFTINNKDLIWDISVQTPEDYGLFIDINNWRTWYPIVEFSWPRYICHFVRCSSDFSQRIVWECYSSISYSCSQDATIGWWAKCSLLCSTNLPQHHAFPQNPVTSSS